MKRFCFALVLAPAIAFTSTAAAHDPKTNDPSTDESPSFISETIDQALAEAQHELESGNLPLESHDHDDSKAYITPQGELIIDEKTIATTDAQRALLLEYRQQIIRIAKAGIEIGKQGASLAKHAMGQALWAVFTGTTDAFEKRMEAEGRKIEHTAMTQLCPQLPRLLAAQQALAESLPEFRPYARMDDDDIKDCKVRHVKS